MSLSFAESPHQRLTRRPTRETDQRWNWVLHASLNTLLDSHSLLPAPEVLLTENIFEKFQAPYTLASANQLLELHQKIGNLNQADQGLYYHHAKSAFEISEIPVGLSFVAQPVSLFSPQEMAISIHEQTRAYIQKETMGHLLPTDLKQIQELLLIMMSGYTPDTLCVMARHLRQGEDFVTSIATARASIGTCQKPVAEEIGNQYSDLPTLSALEIPVSRLREMNPELAATPCTEVVCIGRLAVSHQAMEQVKLDPNTVPRLPLQVLAHLGQAMAKVNALRSNPLTYIIYDTHRNSGVAEMSKKFFGGQVVVGPDDQERGEHLVQPTPLTRNSVLDFHYGPDGHQGNIYWMYTSVQDFITKGQRLLKDCMPANSERSANQPQPEVPIKAKTEIAAVSPSAPVDLSTLPAAQREALCAHTSEKPFEVARQELLELAGFYENTVLKLPPEVTSDPEAFKGSVVARLTARLSPTEQVETVAELMAVLGKYDFVFRDVLRFAKELSAAAKVMRETPELATTYLYWPEKHITTKYVTSEIHTLLRRSRMLGLRSFETLDKLAVLDIRWIGTSVAAQSIDLLAAGGNRTMTIIDGGRLEVSNGPRLLPNMGSVLNLGESKARVLEKALNEREPFGRFTAIEGMVTTGPTQTTEKGKEINISEFCDGADVVVEVIDNPLQKLALRLTLQQSGQVPHTIFIADISPVPVAGAEDLNGKFFNQSLSHEDWQSRIHELTSATDPLAAKAGALKLITEILGDNITEAHLVSTLLIAAGVQSFLAQDPSDTRVSAAITNRLILDLIEGKTRAGHTYTLAELEAEYLAEETNRQLVMKVLQQALTLQ